MTEKRFNFNLILGEDEHKGLIFDNEQVMKTTDVAYLLNELLEENEELKKENNMLKTTIARNESYIQQLTHKGGWKL